jgi:hypothetical protein
MRTCNTARNSTTIPRYGSPAMAPDAVMLAAGLTGTFLMNGLPLSAIATEGLRGGSPRLSKRSRWRGCKSFTYFFERNARGDTVLSHNHVDCREHIDSSASCLCRLS